MPLYEAIRLSGIGKRTVEWRLQHGWTVADALSTEPGGVPSIIARKPRSLRQDLAELREQVATLTQRLNALTAQKESPHV